MDFAENYTCIAQREVQSAHWSHNMVTIHPTVAYYRCLEEECTKVVMEHLIFISYDKTHDAAAVHTFVEVANEHLRKRGAAIEKEIQMTDGCSAQYKSKIPFTDISYSNSDLGVPVERHFYGSRHGKGPSDGAGAVVKSVVRRAVMGGNVIINNSKEVFDFAKVKLTKEDANHTEHFKRTLFYIEDINHDRPERSNFCKTLKGTRKVQAVQGVTGMSIRTRNLSCFCNGCLDGDSDCINEQYVNDWTLQKLDKGRPMTVVRARGERRGGSLTRGEHYDLTP